MTSSKRDPRMLVGVAAAKLTGALIRRIGRGGGTAAPGLVAEKLDTGLLRKLSAQLPQGALLVAGTNGKTTTTRMIADMLEANAWRVAHNRSGSNLVRGVVAAFVEQSTYAATLDADAGVIEADEAAMPELVKRIQPRVILLNNLFRDQLDRYGELDAIARLWKPVLAELPETTTVVINADDPALAAMTEGIRARRICIGLNEARHRLQKLPHAADAAICRVCGGDLAYKALYLSHLGEWYCTNCDRQRPHLDYAASDIALNGDTNLQMTVTSAEGEHRLEVGVPGLYNAYNALAAVAVAREFGVGWNVMIPTMAGFRSAFGRIERVEYRNRHLTLALVKNPTGFNEVLRMLVSPADGEAPAGLAHPTLIMINDLDADGRDISWLWDVDFQLLAQGSGTVFTSGIRGADMANRLKYADVPPERIQPLSEDIPRALDAFIEAIPEGESAYILPSYTAMLRLRKALAEKGAVQEFWEQ